MQALARYEAAELGDPPLDSATPQHDALWERLGGLEATVSARDRECHQLKVSPVALHAWHRSLVCHTVRCTRSVVASLRLSPFLRVQMAIEDLRLQLARSQSHCRQLQMHTDLCTMPSTSDSNPGLDAALPAEAPGSRARQLHVTSPKRYLVEAPSRQPLFLAPPPLPERGGWDVRLHPSPRKSSSGDVSEPALDHRAGASPISPQSSGSSGLVDESQFSFV